MTRERPRRLTFAQFMPPKATLELFRGDVTETTGLHWHEFYEMSFIVSGQGSHLLNGKRFSVQRGSLFLLTPADFHELKPNTGQTLQLFNTIFSEEMLDTHLVEMLFHRMERQVTIVQEATMSDIEYEFERLWSEIHAEKRDQQRMIKNSLERILIEFARASEDTIVKEAAASELLPPIRKALIYMQHHFRESLSLKDAAQQANLTPNYFSELFKKSTGFSFQTHLQDLRLSFAKSLLKASNLTVTEICYGCGFNNLTHFEKVFKQKNGISPKEFRKLLD